MKFGNRGIVPPLRVLIVIGLGNNTSYLPFIYPCQGYLTGKCSSTKGKQNIWPNWKNGELNTPFCLIFKSLCYFLLEEISAKRQN